MLSHISTSSEDQGRLDDSHHRKKRVGRACDLCRIKKTKCDGVKPCSRCIQDNKICVFSEKKKQKDKAHPSGYVELLETRLDLLTKSLEKIITMAKPHLDFLCDPQFGVNDSSEGIAINNVVTYLINEEGLLRNLPVEWEKGAMIAANLTSNNKKDIKVASKSFAEHKKNSKQEEEDDDDDERLNNRSPDKDSFTRTDSNEAFSPNNRELDSSPPDQRNRISDQLQLNELPLGGYSTGGLMLANSAALNGSASPLNEFGPSDFESDSNSVYSQHPPKNDPPSPIDEILGPSGSFLTSFDTRPKASSSITSLTDKFEDHGLHSPTLLASSYGPHDQLLGQQTQSQHGIRRSSLSTRPFSPSHQKLKNNGHVFKPHHSHSHHNSNSSSTNFISNNGNEFHLSKKSSTPLTASFPLTPFNDGDINEDFSSFISLPSEAFKSIPNDEYRELDIINPDSLDAFASRNPFANYRDDKV
ncbi:uncharacterized protein PRCAT00002780001 [Priceomyces carsonii]|uniref:uncharacterized protein n=1 Tax=Priceomyces carsonii TaxID=28549 RepID=UPI002ED88A00|nr:unnamed protein product [Priceomyces carsonii]